MLSNSCNVQLSVRSITLFGNRRSATLPCLLVSRGAHRVKDFGEAIGSSSYISIAVPIHALDSVIGHINSCVQPATWVFDMCSATVTAAKKMSRLKSRWFGLHAGGVFGKVRDEVLDYLAEKGPRFSFMTPEEHDRRNSVIAMVHFIAMAAESVLSKADRRILATSPAATNLLRLIDHLRENAPDTYCESQVCNTFTCHGLLYRTDC